MTLEKKRKKIAGDSGNLYLVMNEFCAKTCTAVACTRRPTGRLVAAYVGTTDGGDEKDVSNNRNILLSQARGATTKHKRRLYPPFTDQSCTTIESFSTMFQSTGE